MFVHFNNKSTIFILQIISQFYMYIFLIKFLIVENFTFLQFLHKIHVEYSLKYLLICEALFLLCPA